MMTLLTLLKLESSNKYPHIENKDLIINISSKKYYLRLVLEKYNVHGEIIELKNLSIVTVKPSPKSF